LSIFFVENPFVCVVLCYNDKVLISTVALVVLFELAVAGALQKYPFGVPRTAFFICPMLLIDSPGDPSGQNV